MTTQKPLLGVGLMTLAMALFIVKDSFVKLIVQDVSPPQILWLQFTAIFLVMALVCVPKLGLKVLIPKPFGWQLMRGTASVAAIGMFYWSLYFIPLADATVMASVAPSVVALLSPFMLGERIGPRRIAAVGVGFLGVLIILRPGFGGQSVGYAIAVVAGCLMALFFIGNRRLAGLHPPLVTIAHNALIGSVLLAPVVPLIWVDPLPGHGFHLTGFLIFAVIGQSLMVTSFQFAPAAVIAPYQYTNVVFAIIGGYILFGTFPDALVWAGIVLIVGAGIYIALREREQAGPPSSADP